MTPLRILIKFNLILIQSTKKETEEVGNGEFSLIDNLVKYTCSPTNMTLAT
ncbi:hypothetical protein NIES4075_60680 [Tolypothrix sp. NIES-4075]|nr:hypothetical protein NIES4075_60680 [Tolypothrix sp. NIES-4075]